MYKPIIILPRLHNVYATAEVAIHGFGDAIETVTDMIVGRQVEHDLRLDLLKNPEGIRVSDVRFYDVDPIPLTGESDILHHGIVFN